MKKVLFTAFAAMAFFAMTACNNNEAAADTIDTTAVAAQCCEKQHCDSMADTTCCKADTAACKSQCKGDCKNHEGEKCGHKCQNEAK